MSDLVEFLLARIAEDEQAAKTRQAIFDALPEHERVAVETVRATLFGGDSWDMPTFAPSPARVLAECEAKRRIVEEHLPVDHSSMGMESPNACNLCGIDVGMSDWDWIKDSFPCATLKLIAMPYADHPDYDEAWRP